MSKIYIEARFKMPVLDTDEFGYDKEEVEKVDWEEFAKDDFWNSCEDMGELEDKYDITFHKVQPRLSIPKKIAQELEEYDAGEKGNYSLFSLSAEAREFYLTHNNIVTIYFASKALGVELVSIEED